MIFLIIACIVLVFIVLVWFIEIKGGTLNDRQIINYLESYPKYMDEPTLKHMHKIGKMQIKKSPYSNYTVLELATEECTSITVEKQSLPRPTVKIIKTELEIPTPYYLLRIKNYLECVANEEYESLIREAVYNTDIYNIVDGKPVLNDYTKTIEITAMVNGVEKTYILFIQSDIGILAHETCLDHTQPFEDKIDDFIELYNNYFNYKDTPITKHNLADMAYYLLPMITEKLKNPDDISKYLEFLQNTIKECYKSPCIKQKIYIDIFEKENANKPFSVNIAFKNKNQVNIEHEHLFNKIQEYIDNSLFDLYFPGWDLKDRPKLKNYFAYIQLDKYFKITTIFIPNVGNIDTKPQNFINSINLTEFIYSLRYENFNELYKPEIHTFTREKIDGSGPKDIVKYGPLRKQIEQINESIILEANTVLNDENTKIIFVTLDIGFGFSFVTNNGYYFEFCNNTSYDYKSKHYFNKTNKNLFATCYDGIGNSEIHNYYRINSNIVPYALVDFHKFVKPSNSQEYFSSYLNNLFPAYQFTYENYEIPSYRSMMLISAINNSLKPEVIKYKNLEYNGEKCNSVVMHDETFVHYFTPSRYEKIDKETGIVLYNKKFNANNFESQKFIYWVFYKEEYDKIVSENKSREEYDYAKPLSEKIPFNSVALHKLSSDDVKKIELVLEKFKLYCTSNAINPNNPKLYCFNLIATVPTLHIRCDISKNPTYLFLNFGSFTNMYKTSQLYIDQTISKLKISNLYYKNIKTRLFLFIGAEAFYSSIKNGKNDKEIIDDELVINSFSHLYKNYTVEDYKIGLAIVTFQFNHLREILIKDDKFKKILDYYDKIVKKYSFGKELITLGTIKRKIKIINDIKQVFKNNNNAKILVISTNMFIEYLYRYLKQIDFCFVNAYGADPEYSNGYQNNIYEKCRSTFLNMYKNINEINSSNMYDNIIISMIVMNKYAFKNGFILANLFLENVINTVYNALTKLLKSGSLTIISLLQFPTSIYKLLISNLLKSFNSVEVIFISGVQLINCVGFNYNHFVDKYEYKYLEVPGLHYTNDKFLLPTVSPKLINETEELLNIIKKTSDYIISIITEINLNSKNKDTNFEKLIYDSLLKLIKIFDENNIPYNKYYASIITNYAQKIYIKLITFNSTINSVIVNYEYNNLIINPKCESYYYDYEIGERLMNIEKIYNHVDTSKFSRLDEGRKIYQDFTLGVTKYLKGKKKYNIPVSNAFVKLWEIYQTHDVLNLNGINAFHMCEAPGQWIKTTEEYIYHIFRKKYGRNVHYNWFANSLNPNNPDNINKYGNDIIDDRYSLIKSNKSKWLFSSDDTGDITKSENIRWYRDRFKDSRLNLVTGDAGLPIDLPLSYLQKLDYAQCVLTLAVSSRGANCVIKCFSPYMKSNPITLEATGFFVNLMFLYNSCFETVYLYKPFTSRPQSGEFYIVGKSFTEISETNLEKLLAVLEDFNENKVFIEKENIPDNFEKLIKDFIERLSTHNIDTLELGSFIEQCLNDPDDILKFKSKLESKEIEKIQTNRFKTFCQNFNLI